jgi:hypothetical protein
MEFAIPAMTSQCRKGNQKMKGPYQTNKPIHHPHLPPSVHYPKLDGEGMRDGSRARWRRVDKRRRHRKSVDNFDFIFCFLSLSRWVGGSPDTQSTNKQSQNPHTRKKKGTKKCSNSGTPKEIARGVFFLSLPCPAQVAVITDESIQAGRLANKHLVRPPLHSSRKTDNNKNNMWRSPRSPFGPLAAIH